MPEQHLHSVSVTGVVIDTAGRVLVIQRRDNAHWEPPGGVLERDETFEDGVIREVAEETGVVVAVDRLTGVYKNLPCGIVALVYRCHPLSGQAHSTAESQHACWVNRNEINTLMAEAYAIRIHDAFDNTPASRAHDGSTVLPARTQHEPITVTSTR